LQMTVNDCDNSVIKIKYAWIAARLHHRDVFKASEEKSRCPMRLRLTASQPHQVHRFGYVQQLLVLQGIKTRFTFQITDQSRRYFEVKDQNFGLHEYRSCSGDQGSTMGFDCKSTHECVGEDVFYDHVPIYTRGQKGNANSEAARISAAVVHDLADGKYSYVPYFSATTNLPEFIKDVSEGRRVGTLLVFIDNGIKNDRPMLAIPINLAATPRLDSDESFVGFTASTSSTWQKHDVLGWYYCTEVRGVFRHAWTSTFDFDYNEQSMLSTASYGNTNYPIFIYPDTASWAKRQSYFAANQKVGLAS
ncbi:Hypothetical protein PHPALM_14358, partial [Phytophthora palmivora]